MRPETETGQRVTREWHEKRWDYPDPFADVVAIEQEARRLERERLGVSESDDWYTEALTIARDFGAQQERERLWDICIAAGPQEAMDTLRSELQHHP